VTSLDGELAGYRLWLAGADGLYDVRSAEDSESVDHVRIILLSWVVGLGVGLVQGERRWSHVEAPRAAGRLAAPPLRGPRGGGAKAPQPAHRGLQLQLHAAQLAPTPQRRGEEHTQRCVQLRGSVRRVHHLPAVRALQQNRGRKRKGTLTATYTLATRYREQAAQPQYNVPRGVCLTPTTRVSKARSTLAAHWALTAWVRWRRLAVTRAPTRLVERAPPPAKGCTRWWRRRRRAVAAAWTTTRASNTTSGAWTRRGEPCTPARGTARGTRAAWSRRVSAARISTMCLCASGFACESQGGSTQRQPTPRSHQLGLTCPLCPPPR
jgi:hypothetical protein